LPDEVEIDEKTDGCRVMNLSSIIVATNVVLLKRIEPALATIERGR
jgi:hypothetical protein